MSDDMTNTEATPVEAQNEGEATPAEGETPAAPETPAEGGEGEAAA